MPQTVNLNADLGESFGAWEMGSDAEMLATVNSANVACGFHAGDPLVMCRTVRRARERGVAIGAHPGFPDLQGFGRRRMDLEPEELQALLIVQIGALAGVCRAEGARLAHVKPHAHALAGLVRRQRPSGPPFSQRSATTDVPGVRP